MIQVINLSTPVAPDPVFGSCPINDDEVLNPVPDVFPNTAPLLVLVDENEKPVEPKGSVLHSAS